MLAATTRPSLPLRPPRLTFQAHARASADPFAPASSRPARDSARHDPPGAASAPAAWRDLGAPVSQGPTCTVRAPRGRCNRGGPFRFRAPRRSVTRSRPSSRPHDLAARVSDAVSIGRWRSELTTFPRARRRQGRALPGGAIMVPLCPQRRPLRGRPGRRIAGPPHGAPQSRSTPSRRRTRRPLRRSHTLPVPQAIRGGWEQERGFARGRGRRRRGRSRDQPQPAARQPAPRRGGTRRRRSSCRASGPPRGPPTSFRKGSPSRRPRRGRAARPGCRPLPPPRPSVDGPSAPPSIPHASREALHAHAPPPPRLPVSFMRLPPSAAAPSGRESRGGRVTASAYRRG